MTLVTMIFYAAAMLFQFNWTGGAPLDGWGTAHFRGPVAMEVRPGQDGAEFIAPAAENYCDTFFHGFQRPEYDRLKVQVAMTSHVDNLPLQVAVTSGPGCGSPAIKQRVALERGAYTEITLEYDVTAFPAGTMFLEIFVEGDAPKGKLLTVAEVAVSEGDAPELQCRMFPGSGVIFTDAADQKVWFDWKLRNPEDVLDIELTGERSVMNATQSGEEGRAEFDLSQVPEGDYALRISRNGETVKTGLVRKIVPPPNALTIVDRTPHYQGKPYFAIGLYHVGDRVIDIVNGDNHNLGLPPIERRELFAEIKDRNFNSVHFSWLAAPPDYLRDAADFGFTVLSEGRGDLDGVRNIMNEPNVLGYYSYDEPKASDYENCAILFTEYKEIDPAHPILTAFDSRPSGSGGYTLVDIAMLDPYPISTPTSDVGAIISYAEGAREFLNRDDPGTCEYAILQLFTIDGSRFSVEPSVEQVRAEAYAALVAGVKGIYYYAYYTHEPLARGMSRNPERKYWFLPESELWDAVGAINAEIAAIAPFALEGEDAPGYRLEGIPAFRSWKLGDEILVIAVNTAGDRSVEGVLQTPAGSEAVKLAPYEVKSWSFTEQP